MKLNENELADLDLWLDIEFENDDEFDSAKAKILRWLDGQTQFDQNWDTVWAMAKNILPENPTFEDLWNKLESYANFSVFNENTSEKFDSIIFELDEDGKIEEFILQNVDDNSESIFILPSAELKDMHFFENNLVFTVTDKYNEEMELWLQVRVAPQIEI